MLRTSRTAGDSPQNLSWTGAAKLRLAAMGGSILLLAAAILWIKMATWNRVWELQHEFRDLPTKAFYLGTRLEGSIWRLNGRLLHFQLSLDPGEREAFRREAQELTGWIARTQPEVTTPEERELALQAQQAFAQYLAETATLLEQGARPVRKDTASIVYQQVREKSDRLLGLCQQLVECQDAALAKHFAASGTTLGALRRLMLCSTILLLLCAAAIAVLAYHVVVAPLRLKLGRTEQAVVRQEKLASLGTLAAGVAHEIRNPLASIKFRLFSFKKELPQELAEHEDLAVIHGEIDRLERIVGGFLQFARPSEPECSELAVSDLLRRVEGLMKGSLEKRGIVLRVEIPEAIRVVADPQQIQQVLINLVRNAADSIARDGTITLRAAAGRGLLGGQSGPVVILEVTDTGEGISPEVERRIFDPFFSTRESGTGLGLTIAARIAEQHGGAIHYRSLPKRGTTFSLVLPRIIEDANADPAH